MLKRIAIQGERGSFAEDAGKAFFGEEAQIVFCRTLENLRTAIENGSATYAVLPVENSLVGSVEQTSQFLQTVSWQTADSLFLPIRQSLIACRAARLQTIKSVESQPAALAQCRKFFLTKLHLRQITSANTAASAKSVIEGGDATRAAIANARTAGIFGGKVLLENVQDGDENFMKFLLLKKLDF